MSKVTIISGYTAPLSEAPDKAPGEWFNSHYKSAACRGHWRDEPRARLAKRMGLVGGFHILCA